MLKERVHVASSGWPTLAMLLAALLAVVVLFLFDVADNGQIGFLGFTAMLSVPVIVFLLIGLFVVNPNQGRVLQLFGRYVGTVKDPGLRWANPLFTKHRISLRVRNFETERSKVNDVDGNPIEIAAVVVWKVVDTAEASFEVDDYANFVKVQSESAVRNLATRYPYDTRETERRSLRGDTEEIAGQLQTEIQGRLDKAGVEVLEARITHLAYAQEIAAAMLQRQQAGAIVAARTELVDGAVGMVEMALDRLSSQQIVELDEERKATMVSNLLVVLCGDKSTQPVVNAGSLYQ